NPYPSLHLAKLYHEKKENKLVREFIEKAITIQVDCIDAWGYLFQTAREEAGEGDAAVEKAVTELEKVAEGKKSAAPYVALQGFFANEEATRERAVGFAKKAIDANPEDALGYLCLSALYGQKGDLDAVIKLLQPHEAKMSRDVRLAN